MKIKLGKRPMSYRRARIYALSIVISLIAQECREKRLVQTLLDQGGDGSEKIETALGDIQMEYERKLEKAIASYHRDHPDFFPNDSLYATTIDFSRNLSDGAGNGGDRHLLQGSIDDSYPVSDHEG